jgi:hypothetical protein
LNTPYPIIVNIPFRTIQSVICLAKIWGEKHMSYSIKLLPVIGALLAATVAAAAASAQDAAAPAAAAPAPAAAPAAADAPPLDTEGRWGLVAETDEFMLFAGEDSVEGRDDATTAQSLMVLREPSESGLGAQITYYIFNCNTERYAETGFRQLSADMSDRVYQAGQNEMAPWEDNNVAEEIGRIACEESQPQRVFRNMAAAFEEAQQ